MYTARPNRREANRLNVARYRRRHNDSQTGHAEPDPFRNNFLLHDSRLLPNRPVQPEPTWSIVDDLRDALDADPPLREVIADTPERDTQINIADNDASPILSPVAGDDVPPPVPIHHPQSPRSRSETHERDEPTDNASITRTTDIPAPQQVALGIAATYTSLDPQPLAECLVDQLVQHHGCVEHLHEAPLPSAVSLSTLSNWNCPDILSVPGITKFGFDWANLFPVAERRQVYTGCYPSLNPRHDVTPASLPAPIDLTTDSIDDTHDLQVFFDIDSTGGFASSLAVARKGLKWKVGRAAVSNLQTSLHLDRVTVHWHTDGRPRTARRPLHQVPHLPFGRIAMAAFPEVEVYLIFPHLYDPSRDHWVITVEEYTAWTNLILLPAIREVYPASRLSHMPSSAEHITYNRNAAQVESRSGTHPVATYSQDFHSALQEDGLGPLWAQIQHRVQQDGLRQYRDCQILLTAKNLKLATQGSTWSQARDQFFREWHLAINPAYLTEDFYDVAKEVVPSLEDPARTLSWRRCCLEGFSSWLAQTSAAAEPTALASESGNSADSGDSTVNESDFEDAGTNDDTETNDANANDNADEINDTHETQSRSQPQDTDSFPPRSPRWRWEYYPQSMVRDQGSMTLAPHLTSPLWKRGLRYCQMYNTSKDVFAAGNQYLFGNKNFDSLALDPAMLRSWQHIGGAISHSPLALARGYVHTKQRSHIALAGCRSRSYSTREEYRVTGTVLAAMDQMLRDRGMADSPITVAGEHYPFWIHPTAVMLDWWRWNINRLCVGFEMTYSLRPRTFVHWEHTRVMMMFLKCLLYAYGGQGGHPRRSVGLWIDRRTRNPSEGSDTERIQEGMAMGDGLDRSGYAWFADKIDWAMMVFLPSCRAHMVFNTPSLQSAYHARYSKIKQSKGDFLFFHDTLQQLLEHRHDRRRSALLLQLLVNLCLRSFRQDVFGALSELKIRQPLHKDHLREAQAGDIPLTLHSFHYVFDSESILDSFHVVNIAHAGVPHIDTLFVRLWGWDGDGNQGDWERRHWEFKAYRVLFRQCYEMIAQAHGVAQAYAWRQRLKDTLVRSHWIIPYPNNTSFWARTRRRLQIWSSVHPGVYEFYEQQSSPDPIVLTDGDISRLPRDGWVSLPPTSLLQVELPDVPPNLDHFLALTPNLLSEPAEPALEAELTMPLAAPGFEESSLSEFLGRIAPERMTLRSFKKMSGLHESQVHSDRKWQRRYLIQQLQSTILSHQEQINNRQRPILAQQWQARFRPALSRGLDQLYLTEWQRQSLDQDDSDPGTLDATCERHRRRIRRTEQRLKSAKRHLAELADAEQVLEKQKQKQYFDMTPETMDWKAWNRSMQSSKYARRAEATKRYCERRLHDLSQQSMRPWFH